MVELSGPIVYSLARVVQFDPSTLEIRQKTSRSRVAHRPQRSVVNGRHDNFYWPYSLILVAE